MQRPTWPFGVSYDTNGFVNAQGFTTGSNVVGYLLASVDAVFETAWTDNTQRTQVRAEEWSETGAGQPQAKLWDLAVPADFPSGNVLRLAAPDGAYLEAGTLADGSTLTVTAKSRGTATVTVTARDGRGGTATDSLAVTVKAAPTVASPLADLAMQTSALRSFDLAAVFADADNDARIDLPEYAQALADYLAREITYAQLLQIHHAYQQTPR